MTQNSAARLFTDMKFSKYITPVFLELHWLPIFQFVDYKILLLTDKAFPPDTTLFNIRSTT
jgi:hypothetical protein